MPMLRYSLLLPLMLLLVTPCFGAGEMEGKTILKESANGSRIVCAPSRSRYVGAKMGFVLRDFGIPVHRQRKRGCHVGFKRQDGNWLHVPSNWRVVFPQDHFERRLDDHSRSVAVTAFPLCLIFFNASEIR